MMIRMDKKSSKSYVNSLKVCHHSARASLAKNRIRDYLPDIYISENAE